MFEVDGVFLLLVPEVFFLLSEKTRHGGLSERDLNTCPRSSLRESFSTLRASFYIIYRPIRDEHCKTTVVVLSCFLFRATILLIQIIVRD